LVLHCIQVSWPVIEQVRRVVTWTGMFSMAWSVFCDKVFSVSTLFFVLVSQNVLSVEEKCLPTQHTSLHVKN
jgi:hypothetical protein